MAGMMDTLRGFGRTKVALMAIVSVMLIGSFAVIALRISSPALTSLYSGLSLEDSSKVAMELGKLGVPYELRGNGSEIMVPSERALRLRMTLAEQGLPSNGSVVGYEIFDKSEGLGTSNSVMNVNIQRSMEGELARTIGSFRSVESARVHLVMPKRELFSKNQADASASVAVKLRGGQELTKAEIAAITHFVAAAVPGLKPARINVVDSYGRLLARGDGDESVGAMASAAEEYRVSYEARMRDTLENLVEKVVGLGKVKVQVAADINFDRETTDTEKFDPEGQVARSVQSTTETEKAKEGAAGGDTSVANQAPGAKADEGGNKSDKAVEKSEETTNFEISKTTKRHIKEGGTVNKISVAVLVDGNYTEDADGNKTYAPRSEEELQKIATLIKPAIGFDEKRGDTVEVVNMQFTKVVTSEEEESFFTQFRQEMEGIIQTLIIAGVAILAIMVILRPAIVYLMKATAAASERAAAAESAALAAGPTPGTMAIRLPGMPGAGGAMAMPTIPTAAGAAAAAQEPPEEEDNLIDIQNIKGRVRSSTIKKVVEIVDKNPDETMNVMRQWMSREAS